jgi:hypothetical protein
MSGTTEDLVRDVFSAAAWLDARWNSRARAVSPDTIEWMCTTWGSGRGCGEWIETAAFTIVAAAFDLATWRNRDGRDELVVEVSMDRFPAAADMIRRLEDLPDGPPWLDEDEEGPAIVSAANYLGLPVEAVQSNDDLLFALRIVE